MAHAFQTNHRIRRYFWNTFLAILSNPIASNASFSRIIVKLLRIASSYNTRLLIWAYYIAEITYFTILFFTSDTILIYILAVLTKTLRVDIIITAYLSWVAITAIAAFLIRIVTCITSTIIFLAAIIALVLCFR